MDAIAGKVIDGLSSKAFEEFNLLHDLIDDKERMKLTVAAIKAVLLDAEANATSDHSHTVSLWLEELKEVLYDADDLLDDFSTEALARKVMTGSKIEKEVRIFFSNSNQLAYGHKMSRKMKEIRKKLDDIAHDMNNLPQIPRSSRAPTEERDRRQTYSFVRQDEVIGRDEEKNIIVNYLLDTKVDRHVSVIAVIGLGGLGKTCLAQLAYNDVAVQNYFELKMWVCVSDPFNIREIVQNMAGCERNANIQQVQENLRNEIRGRRFLLVLDDVWSEDRNLWLELKSMLMEGGKGSMVIITTRSMSVAKIMGAHRRLDLNGLDEEKSWRLFSQLAFDEGKVPNNPDLVSVAKEICKKCIGIPLAIKTMANLLYSSESKNWSFIKDSELLSRDQKNNNILDILRLSYDHLSSDLKNCFAYCSLFPKDLEIHKKILIQLWIAQGFIPSSNQDRCPEEAGHDYFMNLLSRCFFQDVVEDEFGDIESCKMHDLMHDLATRVSHNESMFVRREKLQINRETEHGIVIPGKEDEKVIGDRVRHLNMDLPFIWEVQTSLLEGRKLRTLFSPSGALWEKSSESLGSCGRIGEWSRRVASNWEKSRTSSLPVPGGLERLRVLHHPHIRHSIIPESIGKLKHLRYLNLSYSYILEKLPRSITRLHNLQTLKLNHCYELEDLPSDINKMVCLRHLEFDECRSLNGMPCGLGQLTSLQTLTMFSLEPTKSNSARLSELGGLNNLRGRLSICNLQDVRGNAAEAKRAELSQKQHLQHLGLCWGPPWRPSDAREEEDDHRDEMLLQALQPHHSIKSLEISGCSIKMLPGWISNLSSLKQLDISNCDHLASLPESIGNLSSLKQLRISHCGHLASLPESIGNLSSLKQLLISNCGHLASLPESIWNLSSLQQLKICCYILASLPESIGNLSSLKQLHISQCDHLASLPESIGNLSSLQQLEISNCDHLASLPESIGNLSSLQQLLIFYCGHLASLPESVGNLTSLQQLTLFGCNGLASLPDGMRNIRSLKRLRIIRCPLLEERCKREEGEDWRKIAHVPNVSTK